MGYRKTVSRASTSTFIHTPSLHNVNMDPSRRDTLISLQYEQVDLDFRRKQLLLPQGERLVYENQAEAAAEITQHFLAGKRWVVLIAQPGMGKTGTMLETVRQQCMRTQNAPLIDDIMVCTGMSDTDWERTMRDGLLQCFRDRVFHRGRLPKPEDLSKMRNGLIVADECHIACATSNVLGKTLKAAGLLDINSLVERNMCMLEVSATPEAVAEQLRLWGDLAAVVMLKPSPIYKGFQSMLDDKCLHDASEFDLKKPADALRLLSTWDERYAGHSKRWFPCRVYSSDARNAIMSACRALGWDEPKVHDSASRIDDIDAAMEKPIFKHTVVLIKQFWRASKRLIRTNVGGTYETTPGKMDTTATSQGLTARFCDNFIWKGEQTDVNLRPLHFTDIAAVRQYLNWYNEGCVYGKVPYDAARMKSDGTGPVKAPKSKVHPTNVVGLEGVIDVSNPRRDLSRQHKANVVLEEFPSMDALTARWMGISTSLPMCKSDGKPRVPHKDATTDRFKCSLGDVSAVQSGTDVRAFASRGTVGWGAGLTNARAGEIIKRVYVGYDGDVPRFFLRWTYAMPEPLVGATGRQFFAPRK